MTMTTKGFLLLSPKRLFFCILMDLLHAITLCLQLRNRNLSTIFRLVHELPRPYHFSTWNLVTNDLSTVLKYCIALNHRAAGLVSVNNNGGSCC